MPTVYPYSTVCPSMLYIHTVVRTIPCAGLLSRALPCLRVRYLVTHNKPVDTAVTSEPTQTAWPIVQCTIDPGHWHDSCHSPDYCPKLSHSDPIWSQSDLDCHSVKNRAKPTGCRKSLIYKAFSDIFRFWQNWHANCILFYAGGGPSRKLPVRVARLSRLRNSFVSCVESVCQATTGYQHIGKACIVRRAYADGKRAQHRERGANLN